MCVCAWGILRTLCRKGTEVTGLVGKLATMILSSSEKLGAPLLASLLFLQTGCLCLSPVYADFGKNGNGGSIFKSSSGSNHYGHHYQQHVSQRVTQQPQSYYEENYEPYLVNYNDDDDDDDEVEAVGEEEPVEDENTSSGKVGAFQQLGETGVNLDNAIVIRDFISLSSAKVLMKVKESERGGVTEEYGHQDIFRGYSSNAGNAVGDTSELSDVRDKERFKRLEKKFLSLLGMKSRPKRKEGMNTGLVTPERKSVPKELLDLYNKQSNSEIPTTNLFLPGKLTRNANTVRVINPAEISVLGLPSDELHAILKFDLSPSSIPVNEQITGAELRLPFSITVPSKQSLEKNQEAGNTAIIPPAVFARVLLHDIVKPQFRKRPFQKASQRSLIIPVDTEDINLSNKPITHVIDSKLVNLTNRKYSTFWLTFDLLPAVLRWMSSTGNHTNGNYGVAVEIVGLKGEKQEEIQGGQVFNMKLKQDTDSVTLFLYSDDGHNAKARRTRSKREAGTAITANIKTAKSIQRKLRRATSQHHYHQQQQYYRNHNQHYHHRHHYGGGGRRRKPHRHKNKRRNLCSKKPMFVDFTDVGWNDWIVAPPGYQAYYCSGECPFPMAEHLNATNHAVIQALINSLNPSLVPPPCCVPNKYSSLSLLYTDSSDRIVLKNYNEMVVDSCGCS